MSTIASFTVGQRVQLHPATDTWMMGDRFGEVVKLGSKYVHVKLDRSGTTRAFSPSNVEDVAWPFQPVTRKGV